MGLPRSRLLERADLLLNLSGSLTRRAAARARRPARVRRLDPAFTQLWHEAEGIDFGFDRHHRFVTVGSAIGTRQLRRPRPAAVRWIATPPPIVLEHWPVANAAGARRRHHRRALARLRLDRARRRPLRAARPLDAGDVRPDRHDLGAVHAGARHRPGRARRPRGARAPRLGAARSRPGGRHAARLPRVRAGLLGRARHRQARLRRLPLRLVQRSQRLLPGLRPAGGRPGDRLSRGLPTGEGLFSFTTAEEAAAALDAGARATIPGTGGRPASWPRSCSTPIGCCRGCWRRCERPGAGRRAGRDHGAARAVALCVERCRWRSCTSTAAWPDGGCCSSTWRPAATPRGRRRPTTPCAR